MKLREGLCRAPKFRSPECGYRGKATWCDHTQARCYQIGNQDRFDLAKPPRRSLPRIHPWDVIGTVLCVGTFMAKPEWWIASILYTISFLMVLPHTRSRVILWLASWRRDPPKNRGGGDRHSYGFPAPPLIQGQGITDKEQGHGILPEDGGRPGSG